MNRRTTIAALAVALSLGALPLLAQGSVAGQPGQRMGGPGRGGPGGPLVPGLNRLDLSDAQREQLRALVEQERQGTHRRDEARQAEQALNAAVFADAPNPQAIEAARTALTAAHTAALDHRIELMQKIGQILTPAQRQELARTPAPGGPRGRGGKPGKH